MSEFEKSVGSLCGTALAGIKPSCMAVCDLDKEERGELYLEMLREQFKEIGIRFEVLKVCESKLVYLVFREKVLKKHLLEPVNRTFLDEYGYDAQSLEDCLVRLRQRMSQEDFPHEVGVFLGYPPEDVNGFIRDPNGCLFSGLWKVYAEPEKKRELFARYKKCTACILKRMSMGLSLRQIFLS